MVFRWPGTSWLDQAGWPASPQGSTVSHSQPSAGIINVRYPAQRFSPWVWGSNAVLRLAQWALWAMALVPMQYFSTPDKYLWGVFNCSVHLCAMLLLCMCLREVKADGGQLSRAGSLLPLWILGTELRFSGLFTSASTNWAIFPVLFNIFNYFPHLNLNSLLLVNECALHSILNTTK